MQHKLNKINIPEINNLYIMNKDDVDNFAESVTLAYKDYPLFKYLTQGKFKHKVIKNIISASIRSMGQDIIGLSLEGELK